MLPAVPPVGEAPVPATPAAMADPAIPHNFQRCQIVSADNTLDYYYEYWACPLNAKPASAPPVLGWVDAPLPLSVHHAAPGSSISAAVMLAAQFYWDAPAFRPTLQMSELVAAFEPTAAGWAANSLTALKGLYQRYANWQPYVDAYAKALPLVLTPSPFKTRVGCLVIREMLDKPVAAATPARAVWEIGLSYPYLHLLLPALRVQCPCFLP